MLLKVATESVTDSKIKAGINTEFKIGDIVRIRSVDEMLKQGYLLVQPDSALAVWQNELCVVKGVKNRGAFNHCDGYKLEFLCISDTRQEKVSKYKVSEYIWTADQLEKYDMQNFDGKEIQLDAYESLIGGADE